MLQLVLVCHATPVVVLAMNTKSSGVINTSEKIVHIIMTY